MAIWSPQDLGDLTGRTVVVTGGNSGIGFHTALALGRAGAAVVIACRDEARGSAALIGLQEAAPDGVFDVEPLDLADLQSVRRFAGRVLEAEVPLDLLVNNAGLMMPPTRETTVDGFEMQFGVNHLGHFALTGLLLPALRLSRAPRVVTVSSIAAATGRIDLGDLQSEKRYRPMAAYAQSKLANLLFMIDLGRRAPWLKSVAAHPGATISGLQRHAFERITRLIGQPTPQGAWPSLLAAVANVPSGSYIGPKDWFHMRGAPVAVALPASALNPALGRVLWDASEQLTGVVYDSYPVPVTSGGVGASAIPVT